MMRAAATFVIVLACLLHVSSSYCLAEFGDPAPASCDLGGAEGEVRDVFVFRDNYVPKEYHPEADYLTYIDISILVLFMVLGTVCVRKRLAPRVLSILCMLALLYLGLARGGCICPVGAVTNVTMGLVTPGMVGKATAVLFLAPILFALLTGRIFCTVGCPLGAIQHLLHKKKPVQLYGVVNRFMKLIPIVMLVCTVYFAARSSYFLVCKLEPYRAVFFTGHVWTRQISAFIADGRMPVPMVLCTSATWALLVALVGIGYWFPRPFCRVLCPYGVLLGIVSIFSFKKRRINKESCVYCGLCEAVCPTQAIAIDRMNKSCSLSSYDCIQCNACNAACRNDAIK